uniref:Uncharacterized protein n=1 Tax=Sinocyclocheilus anshuiensis TaxID=1608454 RepID=A0A671T354_9TELE
MFLVWTLSSLILSYALGFPFLNSTSSGSHMETFLNVTEGNFTEYNKSNQTSLWNKPFFFCHFIHLVCPLATCSLWNLGFSLQIRDEVAGDSARDPMGNGKK